MSHSGLKFIAIALLSVGIGGCSTISSWTDTDDPPLPGDRVSVLELQQELEPEPVGADAKGFAISEPWANQYWPQTGGYPNHSLQNLALDTDNLQKLWSANIGQGSTDRLPLTAQPLIVNGAAFTLDTQSTVRAFSLEDGQRVWSKNIQPKKEGDSAIGGGLGFDNDLLYVTSGYRNVLALDPKNGETVWQNNMPGPVRAAPTIINGTVVVQTLNNEIYALNGLTGEEKWRFSGIGADAGLVGAASPAAEDNLVVAVFSSGDIVGLNLNNGSVRWTDTLAARQRLGNMSSLTDVTALPVIDGGSVYGLGFGGRMTALSADSGNRQWQREISGSETPWVTGNHIFLITAENKLIAMSRQAGTVRWVFDLNRLSPNKESIYWTGPVMADGRLLIASSGGTLAMLTPQDGELLNQMKLDGGVSISPVIAGGTLYILGDNGRLSAYQ